MRQDGYGWDPEIPAVCFAFQVTENEEKNKFELEMFFREAWPIMYATMLRSDREVAPVTNAYTVLGYTRTAYNGLNLMQVFTANTIMQRYLDPDAEVVMMTIPYKMKLYETSPFKVMANAFTVFYFMVTLVPLVFYFIYSLAREKESGMKDLLIRSGLNHFVHFFSWLIHYTIISLAITLFYLLTMFPILF